MPIYDYACASCDESFEELTRFDASPPPCPDCGSADTERMLNKSFMQLNAGGGYRAYMRSPPTLAGCDGGGCGTHNH